MNMLYTYTISTNNIKSTNHNIKSTNHNIKSTNYSTRSYMNLDILNNLKGCSSCSGYK
jgi:hypothetical protein